MVYTFVRIECGPNDNTDKAEIIGYGTFSPTVFYGVKNNIQIISSLWR